MLLILIPILLGVFTIAILGSLPIGVGVTFVATIIAFIIVLVKEKEDIDLPIFFIGLIITVFFTCIIGAGVQAAEATILTERTEITENSSYSISNLYVKEDKNSVKIVFFENRKHHEIKTIKNNLVLDSKNLPNAQTVKVQTNFKLYKLKKQTIYTNMWFKNFSKDYELNCGKQATGNPVVIIE